MRIRLRAPGGASTIELPDDATIGDLLSQITVKTSLESFDISYSYPPKPLPIAKGQNAQLLKDLDVKLNGEQLTIGSKDKPRDAPAVVKRESGESNSSAKPKAAGKSKAELIALKKKEIEGEVPEVPFPERGATVVLRVMPDDNSCLFRSFGTAVVPGDDLSVHELRSLVASTIQSQPEVYSAVVLEQTPDNYCEWIQTPDAWGGAIELGILSSHFEIEICSIDVQSLRVDKFNEGATTRCILVYSGIHYDTIVQSPSEPPHTHATNPPDFDRRVWETEDDAMLSKALQLCEVLQGKNYFTDTGGMAIRCETCQTVIYGQGQASMHAQQTGHYDMAEVKTAK
ncbi:hypothetical protein BJ878DRAFT_510677 [Calycina marina]|uniref:Ubiquitin thioesterase OTU n=1 Tax=Calycina marina TaxID=1763456 RepID=A0A9P8CE57_9HELO|nr:hypothetical protein BJ878DRAFT_510677 [Calycina marina]